MAQDIARNRTQTQPLEIQRSARRHQVRNLTSLPAGKTVPVAVVPLLREDSMNMSVQLAFEMQETVEILLNSVNVDVHAYFVPTLADGRFRSMDDINLSYTGNAREGDAVIPWIERAAQGAVGTNHIHDRLGKHAKPTDLVNQSYIVAYNTVWNHRAINVSPNIPLRNRLDKTLAQAFWSKNQFSHIVPDFDQAVMEGEVALNVTEAKMPVRGIGLITGAYGSTQADARRESDGTVHTGEQGWRINTAAATGAGVFAVKAGATAGFPDIWAELNENGISVSLANIDMARKAQVFAEIRKRYNGLSEEMLIDLLMDSISIPEQAWKQPMLLHHAQTQFGMAKRYASNGEALTQSVVNGAAAVDFRIALPKVPCGGVVIITAEISPEQMFERSLDPWLHAVDAESLPAYTRDFLDPEKVSVVPNKYIDIDHDQPDDVYGYAPLHYEWNSAAPNLGGRFLRPTVDADFDEDRQAFWAVETENPTLTKDAYLVPEDIHLKPFWTSTIDPFDCMTRGEAIIQGNTVFGGLLVEANQVSDYDKVMEKVDQTRIDKEPVAP